jgi:hypothetical protein
MRGLSERERIELAALLTEGERDFDDVILDELELCRRIEAYDIEPDGSHRLRLTELGLMALRMVVPT